LKAAGNVVPSTPRMLFPDAIPLRRMEYTAPERDAGAAVLFDSSAFI